MTSSSSPRGSGTVTPTSNSRIVSQQYSTRDITADFRQAASRLATGQLIKDEYFTLFEAVGALEIGDAKMDSGHLEPGETMDEEYEVLRDLSASQVIGIMDQMFCYEVAWHSGNPLPQTLFTSIYLDRLLWPEPKQLLQAQFSRGSTIPDDKPLVHRVFRAYCIGLIKACSLVHSKITSQHYYEEEDFSSQLYNRPLLHKFDVSDIQLILDDALSWLDHCDLETIFKDAIEKRLLLRQELLTALEADDIRAAEFRSCASLLRAIRATTELGHPVPESFSPKIQRRLASSVPPRPIVSVQPDQAFAGFERFCLDAADVEQITAAETNGSLLSAISTFMSRNPQPSVYVRAMVQLAVNHDSVGFKNQSTKDVLFTDLDSLVMPGSILLRDRHDRQFLGNGTTTNPQPAKLMDDFARLSGFSYLNMFRTLCLNRSRLRRTLCHAVVEWDRVQMEAEAIDAALRDYTNEKAVVYTTSPEPTYAYPLSSWVYHYKLRQLEQIIQLGFELTIFATDEFPHMYWYLSHICSTHISHLDRMHFFVEHEANTRNVFPVTVGKDRINPVQQLETKVHETQITLDRLFVSVQAMDSLARSLHLLYTLLGRHGALPKPTRPYSSDRLRYELRIRPFLPLTIPEPVSYEDFKHECSLEHIRDEDLVELASRAVVSARKWWEEVLRMKWADESIRAKAPPEGNGASLLTEWVSDVKNTIRACIATSVAIATLRKKIDESAPESQDGKEEMAKGLSRNVDLRVEIPLPGEKGCWHKWWIVPKIL